MHNVNSAKCTFQRLSWAAALLLITSVSPAFAQYTLNTLASFSGSPDGSAPVAGLLLSGNTLYGTTQNGGANGDGAVFSLPISGGTPTILASFNGTTTGSAPLSDLILSGSTLYGTTSGGGASSSGEVFSVPTSAVNATPTVLASFNGTSTGNGPAAGLILSGSTLYGTTSGGGAHSDGEVFSLPITGGTPTVLGSFSGTATGSNPDADLILSGTTLYGTTRNGGANSDGAVFSESISGGTPTRLASFNNTDGKFPVSSLVLSGTTLFGTAQGGGGNNAGVVFSLPIAGGTPSVLTSFTQLDGNGPVAGLILSGSTLFGTTDSSITTFGEAFSLPTTGGTPNILTEFHNFDGQFPAAPLVMDASGNLYGTTEFGGASANNGTVFALAVPEPASASLFALTSLAMLHRRRRAGVSSQARI
jgi:uncharacterized repeat protein (TIGR03803 family)